MKKQGKIYLGILLSFIMACLFSVSVMAAGETTEDLSADLNSVQMNETDENTGIEGELKLYESDPGKEEETVSVPVTGISLSKTSLTMVVGQTATLTAAVEPSDADNQTVIWSSSKKGVAAVNNGTVTAVEVGTATITAASDEDSSISGTCTVTISACSDGFHQDPDSGDWYYYKDGAIDTSMTDVVNATVGGKSGWWNVVKGKVTKGETVAQNSNGWWYINSDGMVDFSYKGFAKNSNGWWYLENGKVSFSKNSVIQDTGKKIDGAVSWWYVTGSKVQTGFTGLADYSNENGWWYIENGKVTFTANTVAKNKNGWWYVEDSQVKFKYNGFGQNSNGWWYIENGKVTFKKNSVIKDTDKKIDGAASWWYVVGSQVKTSFTGLADYANENGWWYLNNGKVDFSYSGFAQNKNGWWYVKDSQVKFNTNSVIKGTVNGTEAWWYVVGGKVQTGFTGLADYPNENGWWYIKNGKVDFTVTTVASNKNGMWYVKNGQVAFNYSGTVTLNGAQYTVTNGKVGVSVSSTMNSKAQAQSSSTKWLIVVDTSACRFGVFEGSKGNWTAMKYWKCSPGKPSTPTKKGKFTVKSKGKSFSGKTYTCWYYTQFYGNYLIHSVLYQKGSMTKIKTGTLGKQLSHGCVRLAIENAKWVYDNIPRGTTVYIY